MNKHLDITKKEFTSWIASQRTKYASSFGPAIDIEIGITGNGYFYVRNKEREEVYDSITIAVEKYNKLFVSDK